MGADYSLAPQGNPRRQSDVGLFLYANVFDAIPLAQFTVDCNGESVVLRAVVIFYHITPGTDGAMACYQID